MKLSPWKTKMVHIGCHYFTVSKFVKKSFLYSVYDEDYSKDDESGNGWVDVSDLTDMRVWEFEKLNELLKQTFGFITDSSGNLKESK